VNQIQTAYYLIVLVINIFISSFAMERKFPWPVCVAAFLVPVLLIEFAVNFFPEVTVPVIIIKTFKEFLFFPVIIILFKGRFYKKIFIFFALMTIMSFFSSVSAFITRLIFNVEPVSGLFQYLFPFGLLLVWLFVFLRFCRTFTTRMFAFTDKINWTFYVLGAALSWCSVQSSSLLLNDPGKYLILVLIGICNLVIIFTAILNTQKKIGADYELSLAQEIIASGVDYYKRLDQILQEIRILRHDYRYQMSVIEELAKISKVKYIHKFLSTATDYYTQTEPFVYCENLVINALLVNYAERFTKNSISFSVQAALPTDIPHVDIGSNPLDNYEICIVLGNVLENALEGTMTVSAAERRINLSIDMMDTKLLIEEKNTFDGSLILNGRKFQHRDVPVSRKGSAGGHGLRSVIAVCDRHSGEYLPQWTGNEYTVHILLNL
jgi:hypothetical protein